MICKLKSPFNGKTNKIILTIFGIFLFICLVRLWFYHEQVIELNTKLTQSFHDQAKSSMQYLYTCFLNTSNEALASFIPAKLKSSIKYAVIIDAGSSGSRVYIYYWPSEFENSDSQIAQISQLVDLHDQPVVKKVLPGITHYKNEPQMAYENGIKPLLAFALQHIPVDRVEFTPVYVLATAGMRLLTEESQQQIISAIARGVKRDFKFELKTNHVQVISGIDEGVYAWIAINYILHRLAPHQSNASSTVGSLDMGGGSLQIAYEVHDTEDENLADYLVHLNFGPNNRYKLYVATYLDYGANQVRKAHFSQLAISGFSSLQNRTSHNQTQYRLVDPCLHPDQTILDTNLTPLKFTGSGKYDLCRVKLLPHLNLEDPCPTKPAHCLMNGVYQSPIDFNSMAFYGFSEFWYTMQDVFATGGVYFRDKFDLSAREYCNINWQTVLDWRNIDLYPHADLERLETQCFKAAWLSVVIHEGFGFPADYENLRSTEKIEGREIQWTMGALLYQLMQKQHNYNPIPSILSRYPFNHKRLSYDRILPIFFVILTCSLLFIAWYCLVKRRKSSGGNSFLPILDSIKRRGHSRASSFPNPQPNLHPPSEIPRVTSSSSLRTMLFKNGERDSPRVLDVEKLK